MPALVEMVRDLATFEREPDAVEVDDAMLADALFADAPVVFATVADDGGVVVGMAIHFRNFSTWTGRVGIYLEDLYVRPGHRGRGVGRALLADLARTARGAGLCPPRLVGTRLEPDGHRPLPVRRGPVR